LVEMIQGAGQPAVEAGGTPPCFLGKGGRGRCDPFLVEVPILHLEDDAPT
jgi:hypothetical protein